MLIISTEQAEWNLKYGTQSKRDQNTTNTNKNVSKTKTEQVTDQSQLNETLEINSSVNKTQQK